MKKNEILKTIIIIVVSVILSSGISVYATSTYLYDSCDVNYDNTSSGLNASNVQSSLDELYMHATDYTEIKNYFQNNPTSYFDGNWLNIKSSDSLERGIGIYDSNNNNRSNFFYDPSTDITYLDAKNSNGTFGQGTLNLRGNPVMINGSEVAKKPVSIGSQQTFTASTSMVYTGVSITIPAHSFYSISFTAIYMNSQPTGGIVISSSSSSYQGASALGGAPIDSSLEAHTAVSGYTTSSSLTLYVWAKYAVANNNRIDYYGFYIPA